MFNKPKFYEGHREYKHTYTYKGKYKERIYLVHRDGTISLKSTGRPMKRIIRKTVRKNGNVRYQVQIRFPGKFYNWERVVAAAWFPNFDITDPEQIIKHRNGKKFDMRPHNLYISSREAELKNQKFLDSTQQEFIKYLYEKEGMKIKKIAKLYGVHRHTISKVVRGLY